MANRRGDDGNTPPETPLSKLVRDTPSRDLTPLDERLSRYVSELDSVPPPPELVERKHTFVRMRGLTQSGTWDLESMLAETRESVQRIAAEQLARERDSRLAAEHMLHELTSARKARRDRLVDNVVASLTTALILFVASIFWELGHK